MSQIGRMPINIPESVEINNDNNNISVKGKLGNLEFKVDSEIKIGISDNQITVSRNSDQKKIRELHGLTRSLINNMIIGVSEGFRLFVMNLFSKVFKSIFIYMPKPYKSI